MTKLLYLFKIFSSLWCLSPRSPYFQWISKLLFIGICLSRQHFRSNSWCLKEFSSHFWCWNFYFYFYKTIIFLIEAQMFFALIISVTHLWFSTYFWAGVLRIFHCHYFYMIYLTLTGLNQLSFGRFQCSIILSWAGCHKIWLSRFYPGLLALGSPLQNWHEELA